MAYLHDSISKNAESPLYPKKFELPLLSKDQDKTLKKQRDSEIQSSKIQKVESCKNFEKYGEQILGYLTFVKFAALLMMILGMINTLPLGVMMEKGEGKDLLQSLSIIRNLSQKNLDLTAYFTVPLSTVHFLFLILLAFKLRNITKKLRSSFAFPSPWGVFLNFPVSDLSESEVIYQIQEWFKSEMKRNQAIFDQFPEFKQFPTLKQPSEDESLFSDKSLSQVTCKSLIIESVMLSFSFEEYSRLHTEVMHLKDCIKQETGPLNSEEVAALLEIYKRKNNMLGVLSKSSYCLVIFKKPGYNHYFLKNGFNNVLEEFLCPQSCHQFHYNGQKAKGVGGLFPNQINWEHLHLFKTQSSKRKIITILAWLFSIFFIVAVQFSFIYFIYRKQLSFMNGIVKIWIGAIIINILICGMNYLLRICSDREIHAYYSSRKKSFTVAASVGNFIILSVSPLWVCYLLDSQLILTSSIFLNIQLANFAIFAVFTIANIYFCPELSESAAGEKEIGFKRHRIQYLMSAHFTVIMISYFLTPLFPLFLPLAALWFGLVYILEKINFLYYFQKHQYHGKCFIASLIPWLQRLSLCYIISLTFLWYVGIKSSLQWDTIQTIALTLHFGVYFLGEVVGYKVIKSLCDYQKGEEQGKDYKTAKTGFIIQYEDFNFAISRYKGKISMDVYSARIKIYEQLNTMSKTLSSSLKEKLFACTQPIMDKQQKQEKEEAREIYFEYQKKVHMKKIVPKVTIPPLFKKEERQMEGASQGEELINFNSVFSQDDKDARRLLKKHILNRLNEEAIIR